MKNHLHRFSSFFCAILIIFGTSLCTGATDIKTSVNGRIVKNEDANNTATLIDDVPYIPVSVAELAVGDIITWDGSQAKLLTAENGIIPVIFHNDVPMISAHTAEEVLGLTVNYNSSKSIISVIKPQEKQQEEQNENTEEKTEKTEKREPVFITVVKAMNQGFLVTLKLFFVTLIGALPLGLVISLCSMSKFLPLKLFTRLLIWIIRGTPLMLQLLIIFFIPGVLLDGKSPWPSGEEGRFMAASVAFIINYAFYFSEIYRGGIESIPHGQVEAGQVLGMTKTQIFFNVTLLQMIKRIVPPMSNEIITLVKDTSIARIISLQEVIWAGYAFLKSSHGYSGLLWPLFFTGVYYLAFNGILTIIFSRIEKKLGYFN